MLNVDEDESQIKSSMTTKLLNFNYLVKNSNLKSVDDL